MVSYFTSFLKKLCFSFIFYGAGAGSGAGAGRKHRSRSRVKIGPAPQHCSAVLQIPIWWDPFHFDRIRITRNEN